jgi:hypothetical protein
MTTYASWYEEWQKAKSRRDLYAFAVAKAHVEGKVRDRDIAADMFKGADAELRRLENEYQL